jgi:hypothetical protein
MFVTLDSRLCSSKLNFFIYLFYLLLLIVFTINDAALPTLLECIGNIKDNVHDLTALIQQSFAGIVQPLIR